MEFPGVDRGISSSTRIRQFVFLDKCIMYNQVFCNGDFSFPGELFGWIGCNKTYAKTRIGHFVSLDNFIMYQLFSFQVLCNGDFSTPAELFGSMGCNKNYAKTRIGQFVSLDTHRAMFKLGGKNFFLLCADLDQSSNLFYRFILHNKNNSRIRKRKVRQIWTLLLGDLQDVVKVNKTLIEQTTPKLLENT